MPTSKTKVMDNYKLLLDDPNMEMVIPEAQLKFDYLAIYYLTGPKRLTDYLKVHCLIFIIKKSFSVL